MIEISSYGASQGDIGYYYFSSTPDRIAQMRNGQYEELAVVGKGLYSIKNPHEYLNVNVIAHICSWGFGGENLYAFVASSNDIYYYGDE